MHTYMLNSMFGSVLHKTGSIYKFIRPGPLQQQNFGVRRYSSSHIYLPVYQFPNLAAVTTGYVTPCRGSVASSALASDGEDWSHLDPAGEPS